MITQQTFNEKIRTPDGLTEIREAVAACILLTPGGAESFETEEEEEGLFFEIIGGLAKKDSKDLLTEARAVGIVE